MIIPPRRYGKRPAPAGLVEIRAGRADSIGMKILILFSRLDEPMMAEVGTLLSDYADRLVVHRIEGNWKDDAELMKKLDRVSLIFILMGKEDLRADWCAFISGYCLGKECGLVFYQREEMALPPYMSAAVPCAGIEDLERQVGLWRDRLKEEEARGRLHDMGLYLTPYHFLRCLEKGEKEAVSTFLLAGCSPDTVDEAGVPALCLAARQGETDICRLLLDSGCDLDAVASDRDNTALMDAAAGGNAELASMLISRGARLEQKSKNEQTALMLAVGIGNARIARLLLDAGADPGAKDVLGMSAALYAKVLGHKDILEMLESRRNGPEPAKT
jgi:hypothetical protein